MLRKAYYTFGRLIIFREIHDRAHGDTQFMAGQIAEERGRH